MTGILSSLDLSTYSGTAMPSGCWATRYASATLLCYESKLSDAQSRPSRVNALFMTTPGADGLVVVINS